MARASAVPNGISVGGSRGAPLEEAENVVDRKCGGEAKEAVASDTVGGEEEEVMVAVRKIASGSKDVAAGAERATASSTTNAIVIGAQLVDVCVRVEGVRNFAVSRLAPLLIRSVTVNRGEDRDGETREGEYGTEEKSDRMKCIGGSDRRTVDGIGCGEKELQQRLYRWQDLLSAAAMVCGEYATLLPHELPQQEYVRWQRKERDRVQCEQQTLNEVPDQAVKGDREEEGAEARADTQDTIVKDLLQFPPSHEGLIASLLHPSVKTTMGRRALGIYQQAAIKILADGLRRLWSSAHAQLAAMENAVATNHTNKSDSVSTLAQTAETARSGGGSVGGPDRDRIIAIANAEAQRVCVAFGSASLVFADSVHVEVQERALFAAALMRAIGACPAPALLSPSAYRQSAAATAAAEAANAAAAASRDAERRSIDILALDFHSSSEDAAGKKVIGQTASAGIVTKGTERREEITVLDVDSPLYSILSCESEIKCKAGGKRNGGSKIESDGAEGDNLNSRARFIGCFGAASFLLALSGTATESLRPVNVNAQVTTNTNRRRNKIFEFFFLFLIFLFSWPSSLFF